MKTKFILIGKACSGKDYTRTMMQAKGMKYGVPYTTREKRPGEVHMVDYNFISKEEFEKMLSKDEFTQYNVFGEHYYGTSRKSFEECDVFIMSPNKIKELRETDRKRSIVMMFHADSGVRYDRMRRSRGYTDEDIRKREELDAKFDEFNDYDLLIKN